MKKRVILLGMLVLMSVVCAGCGSQTLAEYQQQNNPVQNEEQEEMKDVEEVQKEQAVTVNVYFSNSDATGFEISKEELQSLTPQALVNELARVNVVAIDTEVLEFSQAEKSLSLDLSAEFSKYLNMMGTTGEYIVVGSLVNTFLDAYEAEEITITVKGKTLETSHAIYDKPLTKYVSESSSDGKEKTDEAEAMNYRLKDTAFTQEEKVVHYPQFDGMPDENIQNAWNQMIESIAMGNALDEKDLEYESYAVDYKVGYCALDKISFLFTRTSVLKDEEKTVENYAITFDLKTKKCLRFSDFSDSLETVSYNMANNGYYKIKNKNISNESFAEYFGDVLHDDSEYRELFLRYDFDETDLSFKPLGYMFITADGEIELIMDAEKDLANEQILIETGVKIK